MLIKGYRYSYKLNTSHDMSADGNGRHLHTFQIHVFIEAKSDDGFVTYFDMTRKIDNYLGKYKGGFMNEFPPFDVKKPTIENMAEVFYQEIGQIINDENFKLFKLELGETPLNRYIVSDQIVVGDARYMKNL